MLFKKEELGIINTLIDAQFDNSTGQFRARGVDISNRVNSIEIYKKIYTHVVDGIFNDGDVEFNPQEKEYLKNIFKETLPAEFVRKIADILPKIE